MNTTFTNIIKQIVSQQGEAILGNPARLKIFVAKYAKNEPKEIRLAFGRCIEQGYYRVLKQTSAPLERQQLKPKIAQQMHNISKLPLQDCTEAVDILEAVLYGEQPVQNAPPTRMLSAAPPQRSAACPVPRPQTVSNKKKVFVIFASAAAIIILIIGLAFWHRNNQTKIDQLTKQYEAEKKELYDRGVSEGQTKIDQLTKQYEAEKKQLYNQGLSDGQAKIDQLTRQYEAEKKQLYNRGLSDGQAQINQLTKQYEAEKKQLTEKYEAEKKMEATKKQSPRKPDGWNEILDSLNK
jgi:hypothetical protein